MAQLSMIDLDQLDRSHSQQQVGVYRDENNNLINGGVANNGSEEEKQAAAGGV